MLESLTDNNSTSVQMVAWCRMVLGHHLDICEQMNTNKQLKLLLSVKYHKAILIIHVLVQMVV